MFNNPTSSSVHNLFPPLHLKRKHFKTSINVKLQRIIPVSYTVDLIINRLSLVSILQKHMSKYFAYAKSLRVKRANRINKCTKDNKTNRIMESDDPDKHSLHTDKRRQELSAS